MKCISLVGGRSECPAREASALGTRATGSIQKIVGGCSQATQIKPFALSAKQSKGKHWEASSHA